MEAGLTVTTLNPAYTMPEVARQLEMSKAKIILTEESRVQAVKEAMKQIGMINIAQNTQIRVWWSYLWQISQPYLRVLSYT